MKKLSNKGFTLIELLAVITIMGILMMVAIPAVSRTIENSRRDTFATVAGQYLEAVRNGVLADEIECLYASGDDKELKWRVASSLPDGTYYFPLCTESEDCKELTAPQGKEADSDKNKLDAETIVTSTTDLLESGGKSPFGSADVYGYVTWTKSTSGTGDKAKSKTEYYVFLQDSGKHGLTTEQPTSGLKRSNVNTEIKTPPEEINKKTPTNGDTTSKYFFCKVN